MHRRSRWIFLTLALLNGLVYVFLVPPWQHYDEPNHFEYVWLVAHRPGWPQEGDFDRSMRAATLRSMIAHDFFRNLGKPPSPKAEQPWIGPVAQVGNAPLYYFLAALPLRFWPALPVLPQLYAARLVSLGLFLLTAWLVWESVALLVPPGHPLGWMIPAFVVSLPSFVDIMTAVNDDVVAVAVFSLFLYAALRLLQGGWHWQPALLLFFSAGLCLLAKRTVFFAPALVPVVLLFTWLRGARRRWAWGLTGALLLLGTLAAVRPGDAALWYRRTPQAQVTRLPVGDAPVGRYALRLHLQDKNPAYQVLQLLPLDALPPHAGDSVTLGAWMWASAPLEVALPRLHLVGGKALEPTSGPQHLLLDTQPRFYAWTLRLPQQGLQRAWVQFGPAAAAPSFPVDVFVDGAVLVRGAFGADVAPQWADADAQQGLWEGQQVRNMLRNASAERAWLNPRGWVDALWGRVFGYPGQQFASLAAYSARDVPAAGWYYRLAGAALLRSFWGRFGWGHVPLLGHHPYRGLLGLSVALVLGALGGVWRLRAEFPWAAGLVGGLALAFSWGLTLVRGAHHVLSGWVNIPVARYAFPVILPLAGLLALGWWRWERLLCGRVAFLRRRQGVLFLVWVCSLTLWGWASVYAFYH